MPELKKHLLQGAGVAVLCAIALVAIFPEWYLHPTDHLIGPDRYLPNTDLSNTLLMVQRGILGESGCETQMFSLPLGSAVCSDLPNPFFTWMVAWWAKWFGLAFALNWSSLWMLAFNGASLFWVARLLGARPLPSLYGAILISFCPTIVSEVAFGRAVSSVWAPAILGAGLLVFFLRKKQGYLPAISGALLMGIACVFSPVTVLLIAPWVGIEALVSLQHSKNKRKHIVQCTLLFLLVAAVVIPIAMSQAVSSPTRLLSEGWWGSHLDFGKTCVSGAEIPALYPWNKGRLSPLVGAGSFAPVVFLFSVAIFAEGRQKWIPIAATGIVLIVIGSGPCLGGSTPISWAPIRLLSESATVFKLVPIWRFWAAASILITLAAVLAFNALLEQEQSKKNQRVMHGLFLIAVLFSLRWHLTTSEKTTVAWPTHPTLQHLKAETVLLDLPLLNDRVVIQTHVAELPVPRFNPERHEQVRWRQAVEQKGLFLLQAADAFQNKAPWRHFLESEPKPYPEQALGLQRILLYTGAAEPKRLDEWRAFLSVIGTEFEMKNTEIEVYRLHEAIP